MRVASFLRQVLLDDVPAQAPAAAGGAEDLAIVPAAVVAGPEANLAAIVADSLEVAARGRASSDDCTMGRGFSSHRFFRVLRSSMDSRVFQHDDGQRIHKMVVCELSLDGRRGGAGLFKPRSAGGATTINWRDMVAKHGMKVILNNLVVWSSSAHALCSLSAPQSASFASSLRSLPAISDIVPAPQKFDVAQRFAWGELVEQILTVATLDGEGAKSYVDVIFGRLISMDGERSTQVDLATLQDLISAGVALVQESEFGEDIIQINLETVSWVCSHGLQHGTKYALGHVSLSNVDKQSKLSALMFLCSLGWTPSAENLSGRYYEASSEKVFDASLQRPKVYFVALCMSASILRKLSTSEAALPVIYHGMPQAYYKALLSLPASKMQAIADIIEQTPHIKRIRDSEFAALLDGCEGVPEREEGPEGQHMLAVLDAPSPAEVDAQRVHRIAASVLRGLPAEFVDIRSCMVATSANRTLRVNFDNCSHSSGKQRAYIACPAPHHSACFKYSVVERFESNEDCAAWLMAWADHARSQPAAEFNKRAHMSFVPDAQAVAAFRRLVRDHPL